MRGGEGEGGGAEEDVGLRGGVVGPEIYEGSKLHFVYLKYITNFRM